MSRRTTSSISHENNGYFDQNYGFRGENAALNSRPLGNLEPSHEGYAALNSDQSDDSDEGEDEDEDEDKIELNAEGCDDYDKDDCTSSESEEEKEVPCESSDHAMYSSRDC
eukprot:CAMPEP_0114350590 /NCGR_PEP_ID=MMETSP0101-20121206/16491_1 /TAXON_ID=38822 ORGANISM="Pteridomonas danica, Strain PT" /NCGR_SAMPLE_ID=MMETSP0101 /ASSEMBLY_ACC=CAM_ASM_000211 /LENGTH=110 /DNA_ID=CAMNT_0001489929 /DNA_START=1408 /DNA_END=1740 /DNA_ORIENTATION=+